MPYIYICLLLFAVNICGQVSGYVHDENGQSLPFVNVIVQHTSTGTTTNNDGYFNLKLAEGKHRLVFQFLGYKNQELEINSPAEKVLTINMTPENYMLDEVVIAADAEDPAYAIIRKAQAKRKYYLDKAANFECDAYVRGISKILKAPEKILGKKVDNLGDGLDEERRGVVYLSESISKLYSKVGQLKEHMYSSKVSGDDQGYSFNSAMEMSYNFYENQLAVNRQIITPIADGAMNYYRYELVGTFYAGNQLVNKIKVTPRNDSSPSFFGHIYINEDLWNIHSLDLFLTKNATQIPFVDSLNFTMTYVPVAKEVWMPFSNIINFKLGALGFQVGGTFTCVRTDYIMGKSENVKFNNEIYTVDEESNTRDDIYWESIRPIPLTIEETTDYQRKDSIRLIKESIPYMDSIDREHNKFGILSPIFGYSYQNSKQNYTINFSSPLTQTQVNTVQGWNSAVKIDFNKSFNKKKTRFLYSNIKLNYGFSEKLFRPSFDLIYRSNSLDNLTFTMAGGWSIEEFSSRSNLSTTFNSLATILAKRNYWKLYDRQFIELGISRDLSNVINGRLSINYSHRSPVVNHYDGSLFHKDRLFLSNDPRDISAIGIESFTEHNSLQIDIGFRIKPGEKVWKYPDQKFKTGSSWPTFRINYRKSFGGLHSDPSLDSAYDLIQVTIAKRYPIGLMGSTTIYASGGGFINADDASFIDYKHFAGNQILWANPYRYFDSFLALPYYGYSSNGSFVQFHLEHNFQGWLLDRIPGINKLAWHVVAGYKYLNTSQHPYYNEFHIGLDNIGYHVFKLFRIDAVWSNPQNPLVENSNSYKFKVVLGLKSNF